MDRFARNAFNSEGLITIVLNKEIKAIKIYDNSICMITLYDTPGGEPFRSLSRKYYNNAEGILLFFDVNNIESLEKVS